MTAATISPAMRRHRDEALRALRCGRGIGWAADITTLPVRLVARVAAAYGISDGEPAVDGWSGSGMWDTWMGRPATLGHGKTVTA